MSKGIHVKRTFFILIFLLLTGVAGFRGNVLLAQDLPAFFNMSKNVEGLVREGNLQIGLVTDRKAISPGNTFTLGIKMEHDPGWHTYWSNPGDTVFLLELVITFQLLMGFRKWSRFNGQHKKVLIRTLANYGYENSLLLTRYIYAR